MVARLKIEIARLLTRKQVQMLWRKMS